MSGGDICQAYGLQFGDGSRLFVKTRAGAPAGFFEAEARGLRWLAEADALPLPQVVAVCEDFLALEWLESETPAPDCDRRLGEGLADLHRCSPAGWGLEWDNFIGTLPQQNRPRSTWIEFWIEQRLRPQVQRACAGGTAPAGWESQFQNLFERLPNWLPDEPPSRLHGDLWRGNLLIGPGGRPYLVDPACYAGHREVDLAMMRLFGGFSPTVFAAYQAVYPLQPDWERRVALYQLYPLLVHVNLFGGSYVHSVQRTLDDLLRQGSG